MNLQYINQLLPADRLDSVLKYTPNMIQHIMGFKCKYLSKINYKLQMKTQIHLQNIVNKKH